MMYLQFAQIWENFKYTTQCRVRIVSRRHLLLANYCLRRPPAACYWLTISKFKALRQTVTHRSTSTATYYHRMLTDVGRHHPPITIYCHLLTTTKPFSALPHLPTLAQPLPTTPDDPHSPPADHHQPLPTKYIILYLPY